MANKKQTTTIVKVSQPTKKTSKKKPLKQTTVIKTVVTKEIIQNSRKSGIKKNKQLHHSAVVIKPSNAILGSISNTVNVDKPVSSPTATQVASKGVTTLANNNIRINTSNDIAYAANFDNYYNDFFITCSFIAETDQKTTNKNGDVLPVLFAQFPLMSIEKTYFWQWMEKHEDNFLNEGEKLQASELLLPDYLEDDVSFEQRAYINTILKNEFIYNEAFYSIPLSLFNGNNQLPEKFVLSI